MIPAEAVEAAVEALRTPTPPYQAEGVLTWEQTARIVLEAAAPHIIAGHFREMNLKAITNEIENPPNFSKSAP